MTFGETADALSEVVDDPVDPEELPEALRTEQVVVTVGVPRRRTQHPSRSVRCVNARQHATAVAGHLTEWCDAEADEIDQGERDDAGNPEDLSPGALALAADMRRERRELIETVREIAEKLEEQADEVAEVEFPGMFG